MAWKELISRRTQTAKHFYDTENPQRRTFQQILKTPIHYQPNADGPLEPVDLMPQRVNNAALNGWRVTRAGWHYALGVPGSGPLAGLDGVVGFGGRQGAHWVKYRLQRIGYLHWPTRSWEDLGGQPTYDRANLTRSTRAVTIGPNQQTITVANVANWADIWPGVDVRWRVDGLQLKEEIYLSETTRNNLPNPSTPAAATYFCFAFRLDVSDIPRWVKNGAQVSPDGDFDATDSRIGLKDAQDRLLAFMPVDYAIADDGETRVRLRKRIYSQGGNHWLVIGAPVLELAGLPAGGGITFDPTFSSQPDESNAQDSHINSTAPDGNNSTATVLRTRAMQKHALVEWDLSSIPIDATCDSAILSLWSAASAGTKTYDIYVLKPDWEEGQVTWNTTDGSTAWPGSSGASTSGTDYEADASPPSIIYPESSDDTEAQADLSAGDNLNLSRVESAFFDALSLIIAVTGSTSNKAWHSSNAAEPAFRPKISIDYTESAPPPAGDGPGARIKSRGDLEANWISVNPVLAEREIGLETDTNRFKVGDGTLDWMSLAYWLDTSEPHTHAANEPIIGEIRLLAGPTIPAGWLLIDGSEISRSTYADLFSEIGTTWGDGDGSTTFNLPPKAIFPVAAASGIFELGDFSTVFGVGVDAPSLAVFNFVIYAGV